MIEINLLPWRDELRRKQYQAKGLQILIAIVLSAIMLGSLHWVLLNQIDGLKKRVSDIQASLERLNKGLEDIRRFYQELNYQQLPHLDLGELLKQESRIIEFLQRLSEILPENLRLQELHFEKGVWLLHGVATQAAEVLLFSDRLKKDLIKGDWRESLKKEKTFKLTQKQGLSSFQIQLEPDLI